VAAPAPPPELPAPAPELPPASRLARLRKQLERCALPGTPEEILARVGDTVETRLDLGACAVRAGRIEEGVAHYQVALSRRKDEPWALLGLARAYERAGDNERALRWYRQYAPLAPPGLARRVKASIARLERDHR
jgi:tetratricopeptide (TPR) repeat protein